MSIYVTLPSNGGGKEFGPTNVNSECKIRLPERRMGSGAGQYFATHVRCRQAKHSTQVPGKDQSRVEKWSVGKRGERPSGRYEHQSHSIKSGVRSGDHVGCLERGGARQGRVLLRAKFGHPIEYQIEFSTNDRNTTTSGHGQERA